MTGLVATGIGNVRSIPGGSESVGKVSRKRKTPPKIGICAYCGIEGEITVDHVVPRTLFKERGNSIVRVPACQSCNHAKSQVEPDLRDFIAISVDSDRHPNHVALVQATARSTVRNSSATGRRVKWSRRPISIVDRGRIRDLFVTPNDPEPMLAAVEYIARGLYYYVDDQRVPSDADTSVRYMGHHAPSGSGVLYETLGLEPSGRICDSERVVEVYLWSFVHATTPVLFLSLDFLYGVNFIVYIGSNDRSMNPPARSIDNAS
jgi:hypothetical protein